MLIGPFWAPFSARLDAGLAEYMLSNTDEPDRCIPVEGACPGSRCDKMLLWGDLIKATLQR